MTSLLTLEHDVAKYILRTARNLDEGAPVPAALRPLLLRDLFGREGEAGPAERFEENAASLAADDRDACRADFDRLRSLEAQVRGGDSAATREALALAYAVAGRIQRAAQENQ